MGKKVGRPLGSKMDMNGRLNLSASNTTHNMNMSASDKFKTNVIYQMDFSNGEVYIGCTTRRLSTRISEHCSQARTGLRSTNVSKTIRKHKTGANVKVLEHLTSDMHLDAVETHCIAIAKLKYGSKLLNSHKV